MTKASWKKRIKNDCIKAGTYAEWCESIIDTLAAILEKRDAVEEQFKQMKSLAIIIHTNKGGSPNPTKNPALVMWNDLNTSALAYWRDLGLTPSAFRKMTGEGPKKERVSSIESALKSIEI